MSLKPGLLIIPPLGEETGKKKQIEFEGYLSCHTLWFNEVQITPIWYITKFNKAKFRRQNTRSQKSEEYLCSHFSLLIYELSSKSLALSLCVCFCIHLIGVVKNISPLPYGKVPEIGYVWRASNTLEKYAMKNCFLFYPKQLKWVPMKTHFKGLELSLLSSMLNWELKIRGWNSQPISKRCSV